MLPGFGKFEAFTRRTQGPNPQPAKKSPLTPDVLAFRISAVQGHEFEQ
ncbi:MAG: hypothetical protein ACLTTU_01140 [Bilophila wadsworthia]